MAGGCDRVESAELVEEALGFGGVGGAGRGAEDRQERVDHTGDQLRFPGGELAIAGLAFEGAELGAGDRGEASLVGEEGEVDAAVEAEARAGGGVDGLLELGEGADAVTGGEALAGGLQVGAGLGQHRWDRC